MGELYDAPAVSTVKSRVGQPGAQFLGVRFPERRITLSLTSFASGPMEWARVDSALRKAFDYEMDATLTVVSPLSGARRLKIRLAEEPEYREDVDPHAFRVGRWDYSVVALDPFWRGEDYSDEFVFDGLNWYGGNVTVTNYGDIPTWPKWVLTAPAKFILPDVDLKNPDNKRQVVLPFQPLGRTVLVDTDPGEEMIVANDDALLWAQMSGQFFMNPIPPRTVGVDVPVSVDPLPLVPWVIPDEWRQWIALQIGAWAKQLGLEGVFRTTPEQLAEKIRQIIVGSKPAWLPPLASEIVTNLVAPTIANAIRDAWGSVGNMAGATAQVRIESRWSRPWGME
ncbi:hypothetical protein ACEN19_00010 [Corynebacterium auriscanis]|uniref:hypothetical protein n=1 Tax=Corynebacterium auriscanis TaxID=99807 RepID=UPI003CF31F9F